MTTTSSATDDQRVDETTATADDPATGGDDDDDDVDDNVCDGGIDVAGGTATARPTTQIKQTNKKSACGNGKGKR